jgi:hypothetical protein
MTTPRHKRRIALVRWENYTWRHEQFLDAEILAWRLGSVPPEQPLPGRSLRRRWER